MAMPAQVQPNLSQYLSNQISISNWLFNLTLDTAKTREELERSWFSISHDIDLVNAQEQERQSRNNVNWNLLYKWCLILIHLGLVPNNL